MKILRSVMLVMANVDGNNNKFWKAEIGEDNTVYVTNGRIGGKGQNQPPKPFRTFQGAEHYLESKMREKINKGYEEFTGITDTGTSTRASKSEIEQVAKEQIRTKTDPQIIYDLVKMLVQKNIHNILSRTDLKYDDSTGLFKTPLGFVTNDSIDNARSLLSRIEPFISNSDFNHADAKTLLASYLKLIPQKVGSKLTVQGVLPNTSAIESQYSLLDDLESSIEQVKAGALENREKKEEKITEKVFGAELSQVTDPNVIAEIDRFYKKTLSNTHASSHFRINRVFEVSIDSMASAFEKDGKDIGNIQRLWHGTRVSNVLSILKSGLIIPPTTASHVCGRMFGNGLYFSDQSTKSLNYSYGFWDRKPVDDVCYMFLFDVAMGVSFSPRYSDYSLKLPAGHHSTFVKGGTAGVKNNEMIVYNTYQAIPRYLIEFK